MKEKRSFLLNKSGWIFVALLLLLILSAGCFSKVSNNFKIDSLSTASSIKFTNGQRDWRDYTQQRTFPSGYSGEFWVVFSFSNMLQNGAIKIAGNIYIYSGEEIKSQKRKDVNLINSTDNNLYWGDNFDISTYPDGEYAVFFMITDLITETTVGTKTNFTIGGVN